MPTIRAEPLSGGAAVEYHCQGVVVSDRRRTVYGMEAETHIEEATARIYLDADPRRDWPDPCKLSIQYSDLDDTLGIYSFNHRVRLRKMVIVELKRRGETGGDRLNDVGSFEGVDDA